MAFRRLEQIELESQSPITEKPESELDITNNRISTNQREGRLFIRIANVGITKLQALISFLTAAVLFVLNIQYMEINKICPYNNDFDCYYRYLLCESNCGYERGLIIKDYDFIVEPRKNEFLLNTRIAEIICKLILISLAFSVMLYLGIFTRPLRLYIVIVLSNLLLLRYYRKGDSQGDYTKILSNWSFLLVFKITVSFIVLTILARLNSKAKLYSFAVFGSLILLIFSFIFGITYRFLFSCNYWDQGLHGESIDNTIDCHFRTPNFCLYEFFGNTFDYNQWLMLTCEDRSSHWEVMDEKYPNQPRIGFPIVTHITKEERKFRNVPRYIFSHLQAVTKENEKNFEVILHRTRHDGPKPGQEIYRDPAWIEINVQFNSELVSTRSKLVSESIANNVLVISMDGLSRAGAFRQLKETMKLLETTSPKVHQFFKYHSITPYTPGNMYPLFYGMKHPRRWLRPNPKAREVPSFIHEYKNKGFITGRALSLCALSNINTNYDWQHYNMVDEEPFDHVGMGWACDVNARSEAFDESTTGPLAMVRRCAYGRDVSEYVLEYGKKFWETYKDQKKFLWLDLLDFHDFTFSLGKYLDVHLSKFLKEMDLSETFVIVLGDHGQHVFKDAWWINFESVQTERAAPALFVKLPESLEGVYGDNLEKNKQRFVDAYDLNRLLKGIPNSDQVKDTMLFPLPERPGLCESVVYDQDCFCVKPKLKTESQEKK